MVKRYHESFPSFSYGFDSRYPLQGLLKHLICDSLPHTGAKAAFYLLIINHQTRAISMFKGLFLSLGIIVIGGIVGVPALVAVTL